MLMCNVTAIALSLTGRGAVFIFSGLERLVSGCEFSSDSDGQYRYLSAIYLGFGGLILGSSPGSRARCNCFGS